MSACLMWEEWKMLYGGCMETASLEEITRYAYEKGIGINNFETTGYNGITETIDDEYLKTIPITFVETDSIPIFPRVEYPLKKQFKARGFKANTRFN